MRTALIAIAKNENLYIQEWLDYHLNMGFSTIIVADNDDQLVLSGFSSPRVIIKDYTGVEAVQGKAYTQLFRQYRKDYDWIFFCDVDEFLVIEDGDVNTFLSSFPEDVDTVRLNCKHFTDNEQLDTDDYRVFDRFLTPVEVDNDRFAKSFINTKMKLTKFIIYGHGIYNTDLKSVDAEGNPCTTDKKLDKVLHKVAWVNHYRTKTIGEYIRQKWNRGGANKNPQRYRNWEKYFFVTNTWTEEKIDYANKLINNMII